LKNGTAPKVAERKAATVNTWASAVDSYLQSQKYLARSDRTKSDYKLKLEILNVLDKQPLTWFTRSRVLSIRDKLAKERGRRTADYCATVMGIIFNHAVERDMMPFNPAANMKELPRGADEPEPNKPWLPDELRALIENLPPHVSRPVIFAAATGIRIGDLVKLKADAVRGGVIYIKTSKTGAPVTFEWPKYLGDIPKEGPLFPNSRKKAWTDGGLRHVVFQVRDALVKHKVIRDGLTFHGIRTTFAQSAAKAGFDTRAIADAMGHAQTQMTDIYVREAVKERNSKKVTKAIAGSVLKNVVEPKKKKL
jgi:integrase